MSTSKWGTSTTKTYADSAKEFQELVTTGQLGGEPYPTVRTGNRLFPDFTPRVLCGMDLMDTVLPGWHLALDFTTLDLESDQECVLGQTWPLYVSATGALEALGATEYQRFAAYLTPDYSHPAHYGFALGVPDYSLVNAYAIQDANAQAHRPPSQRLTVSDLAEAWVHRFFEQLTRTWIIQVTAARAVGRWPTPTPTPSPSAHSETTSVPEAVPAPS